MIDKATVFQLLGRRKKADLLEFLSAAFDEMEEKQRRAVFADLVRESRPREGRRCLSPEGGPDLPSRVAGQEVLRAVHDELQELQGHPGGN